MSRSTRVVITVLACFFAYVFTGLIASIFLPAVGFGWLRVSLCVLALGLSAFATWRMTGDGDPGYLLRVLVCACVCGIVGFAAGFIGPIVLMPDANQGPLLGIFFTGPLSFLAGGIGGALYWRRDRRSSPNPPTPSRI